MTFAVLKSYVRDAWYEASDGLEPVISAITGAPVASIGSNGIDFAAMAAHARAQGGPTLREMTFHDRARMIKALAEAVMARKEELYVLSAHTGATRSDGWIDIEGGAGTLFAYASKGRRELPNDTMLLDGPIEPLSKRGTFVGQHIYTPIQGVAVHINAFSLCHRGLRAHNAGGWRLARRRAATDIRVHGRSP